MTYVEPARTMRPEENEAFLADAGLNGPFVADLLSDMLAHERCGAQLYRSVSQRTNSPVLRERYDRFGNETVEHVEILEGLITQLGGDRLCQPGRPDHREGRDGTAGVHVPVVRLGGSHDPRAGHARRRPARRRKGPRPTTMSVHWWLGGTASRDSSTDRTISHRQEGGVSGSGGVSWWAGDVAWRL
jgi:hypothetical protein